ncbi:putative transposon Ty3-I Gag-Pol polyprotein [Operophtera brumata]|uniref:Putative transposon Ty3-I Gag-Pol polyprotein n=1 Tax=Operophtera brumata TaxID=104452 RepID=A0A0L7LTG2_OPEBR|nr:putative transposon Ty3-I Gag-Pol polyprotein [Operophtera brumata]
MTQQGSPITLSELLDEHAKRDQDEEILERVKVLAQEHLPDGWTQWVVTTATKEEVFGESIESSVLNKLVYALLTVGLARTLPFRNRRTQPEEEECFFFNFSNPRAPTDCFECVFSPSWKAPALDPYSDWQDEGSAKVFEFLPATKEASPLVSEPSVHAVGWNQIVGYKDVENHLYVASVFSAFKFVCARRSETIDFRLRIFETRNEFLNGALHGIPPSPTHRFGEMQSSLVRDDGGGSAVFISSNKKVAANAFRKPAPPTGIKARNPTWRSRLSAQHSSNFRSSSRIPAVKPSSNFDLRKGVWIGDYLLSGKWSKEQAVWRINRKELSTVYVALKECQSVVACQSIMFKSNNWAVVSYLRNQGGSRRDQKYPITIAESLGLTIHPFYLPGYYNYIVDCLSKGKILPDWHVLDEVTTTIFLNWGIPQIDMFETSRSKVVPAYAIEAWDSQAAFINAFNQTWRYNLAWIFRPPPLIPRVLQEPIS